MAQYGMILRQAISIRRAIGRGGPWKSRLFWVLKWQRAKRVPCGLKKVEIEAKKQSVATKILKKGRPFGDCSWNRRLDSENFFFLYIFWRARVCRPLLRLCRPFLIFDVFHQKSVRTPLTLTIYCITSRLSLD